MRNLIDRHHLKIIRVALFEQFPAFFKVLRIANLIDALLLILLFFWRVILMILQCSLILVCILYLIWNIKTQIPVLFTRIPKFDLARIFKFWLGLYFKLYFVVELMLLESIVRESCIRWTGDIELYFYREITLVVNGVGLQGVDGLILVWVFLLWCAHEDVRTDFHGSLFYQINSLIFV